MQIERLPTDRLIPYAKNSRTHSESQVAQIAASIREFGFTNPILIDNQDGIIAGHGRVLAARKLSLEDVPCIRLGHLTETQKRAYVIADNKLALNAGWDDAMLKLELSDLVDADFDLSLTGFDEKELDALLSKTEEGLTGDDEVPEVQEEAVTKPGDVWILGKHRLMCGDSTSADDAEKLLNGAKVDLCFTSPPYNAGDSEALSGNTHTHDNKYQTYNDDKPQEEYLDLLCAFTGLWVSLSKCLVVNIQQLAGNKLAFVEWLHQFRGHLVDVAIWDKTHGAPQMAKNVMSNRFEYLAFFSPNANPSRAIPTADFQGTVQNVYTANPQRNNEFSEVHAATFPLHLPEWVISTFTGSKHAIADPFCGTGTTIIACEKLGRRGLGMELDPKYVDVIVKRWQNFTGKKAVHENGKTFEELANAYA